MVRIVMITYIFAFLLMVSGCTNEIKPPDVVAPEQESSEEIVENSNIEDPVAESQVPDEPEEQPFKHILDPDFDRSGGIPIPGLYTEGRQRIAFDLNEIPMEHYPNGEWTVNELEEKYGKADEIVVIIEYDPIICIKLKYNDMSFSLITAKDGGLSFGKESIENPEYTYSLTNEDKDLKMLIGSVHIYGKEAPLPRGLRLGESTLEQVRAAYPPDSGTEDTQYPHILLFLYVLTA